MAIWLVEFSRVFTQFRPDREKILVALRQTETMSVQTADQVLAEGNSLFVDEDYEGALKKFNEAIEMEDTNSDFFAKRSFCFYKLADFPGSNSVFLSIYLPF